MSARLLQPLELDPSFHRQMMITFSVSENVSVAPLVVVFFVDLDILLYMTRNCFT